MPREEQGTSFFTALFRVLDLNPPNMDPLVSMASHSVSDIDLKSVGVNKKDKTLVCSYRICVWISAHHQQLSTIYNTISTKSDLFSEDTIVSRLFPLEQIFMRFAGLYISPHRILTSIVASPLNPDQSFPCLSCIPSLFSFFWRTHLSQ